MFTINRLFLHFCKRPFKQLVCLENSVNKNIAVLAAAELILPYLGKEKRTYEFSGKFCRFLHSKNNGNMSYEAMTYRCFIH